MHDCGLAAGQNSQAANCRCTCSRDSFLFCSAKLSATSLSSAQSGSPTPHSGADPFHVLSRALMCGEASVPRARVERRLGVCVGVGGESRKLSCRRENEV